MHKRFEELCALAATGQITGDAMSVLDQHVKECSACRGFLQDLVCLKAHVAPVVAGSHAQTLEPPAGMRERFLQKAAVAGLKLNPGPALAVPESLATPARISEPSFTETFRSSFSSVQEWYRNAFRYAVPVAAAVLCGVVGYLVAQHQTKNSPAVVATISAMAPAVAPVSTPAPVIEKQKSVTPDYSAQIAALKQESAENRKRLETVSAAALAQAQIEKKELEQKLVSVSQRASEGAQFEQQFKMVAQQLQNADDRIAKLQAAVEVERSKAANAEAVLVAQQSATEDANSKLATLQARLEGEHELNSVKGSAGELIAARNLHIVDVYDTENNGSRKKAFGRVFYVEGRSLVFYAYDLPNAKHANKNLEFRVWGEQAGVKSVSVNLGVMHNDDPGQKRWVLTCDDPKVLGRINAIYIAPGSDSRPGSEPRGEKMMYAFLGSPNHP